MRRNRIRRFLQQKQYAIASFVLFIAIAGMTGVYLSNRLTGQQNTQIAQKETEPAEERMRPDYVSLLESGGEDQPNKDEVESVNSVIKPETDTAAEQQTEPSTKQESTKQTEPPASRPSEQNQTFEEKLDTDDMEQKNSTAAQEHAAETAAMHFSPKSDLGWPLEGDVIMNYSMDQTVYFATLDQYKYNPALVIAGKVNDPVKAAATGRITDISTNEETGVTVTMDLGDGYSAVYGQLKEVLYKEGAVVEAGNAIGYIAEPTKYYSQEGSNLYFKLLKDDKPVNPMQYME